MTSPDNSGRGIIGRADSAAADQTHARAVRDVAWAFRKAIGMGGLQLRGLQQFPLGSCGDVCELLGEYFIDRGLGRCTYRNGQVPDRNSTHAWLQRHGLIVDITADQFPEVDSPVIVERDSHWHRQIMGGPGGRTASFDWFRTNTQRAQAEHDYELLKERADAFRRAD